MMQIQAGVRPAFHAEDHPQQIWDLISAAWSTQPGDRPTMAQLSKALQGAVNAL